MESETLILDSRARITITGSSNETPIWDMSNIYRNRLKGVRTFEIINILIPNIWFQVTNANNNLDLVNNSTNPWTLTMTNGSYASGTAFATQLQADLVAQDPDGEGYTVTYNTANQQFTIVNATGAFSILFASGANTLTSLRVNENVIGFSNTDLTLAATYTSDLAARVQGDDYLILQSKSLIPTDTHKIYYDRYLNDVLCLIPIDVDKGEVINYVPDDDLKFVSDGLSISKLDFTLTNRFGSLSLRGAPWVITLKTSR